MTAGRSTSLDPSRDSITPQWSCLIWIKHGLARARIDKKEGLYAALVRRVVSVCGNDAGGKWSDDPEGFSADQIG